MPAAVALDVLCLGGFWTAAGYQRELDSPNSDLIALSLPPSVLPPDPDDLTQGMIGLGCLWAIAEEAHITTLAVHPHYRRQGLGQMLLITLLAQARHRHLEWATLEVRRSNQAAIALYQQIGFEPLGERRKYYPDGEDALILWLKGLHKPDFQRRLIHLHQQVSDRLSLQCQLIVSPQLAGVSP